MSDIETLGYNQYGNKIVMASYPGGDMVYALTKCCQASDKGMEDYVGCRGCYRPLSDEELGEMYDLNIVGSSTTSEVITLDSMDDFRAIIEALTVPLEDGETYESAWTSSYNTCWDAGRVTIRGRYVKDGNPLTIQLKGA